MCGLFNRTIFFSEKKANEGSDSNTFLAQLRSKKVEKRKPMIRLFWMKFFTRRINSCYSEPKDLVEIAQTEGHSLVVQEDATGTKRLVIRRKEEVDEDYEGLKHGEMPSAVRLTKIQKDEVFLEETCEQSRRTGGRPGQRCRFFDGSTNAFRRSSFNKLGFGRRVS